MDIAQILGRNLQRARLANQYSVGELSRRSHVSKQTIGTIEAGHANPTIETLASLANVLQVSIRTLMTEREEEISVQRASDAEWIEISTGKVRELSSVVGSGYVRSAVIVLADSSTALEQPGQGRGSLRHVIVLDGSVEVRAGEASFSLARHDFARFAADIPHTFRNVSDEAVIHTVTTSPEQTMAIAS